MAGWNQRLVDKPQSLDDLKVNNLAAQSAPANPGSDHFGRPLDTSRNSALSCWRSAIRASASGGADR